MSSTTLPPHKGRRLPAWWVMAGKELRENARWACLGALALAVALGYEGYRATAQVRSWDLIGGLWDSLEQVMLLGAPLMALLMGLLQVVPERQRDLFAFVVHRPATRASLFWGKVAAGAALYTAASLMPLLGTALWARTVGNVPGAFVGRLIEGGATSMIAGLPFYFAALLVVLRPAPWLGSRLLPLIAAGVATASLAISGDAPFSQGPAVYLVMTVVLMAASCIAFETTDGLRPKSQGALAPLGIVIYAGSASLLAGLKAFQPIASSPSIDSLISGLVCAVAAWYVVRVRTLGPIPTIAWCAGSLVLGIPLVVTLLALVPNSPRVPCPRCGKRRIVTRDLCEHCGEPFAGPARDGTEIFERAGAISSDIRRPERRRIPPAKRLPANP